MPTLVQAQGKPLLPEETKKLYRFVGTLEGKGTATMGGKTVPMTEQQVVTKFAEGYGVRVGETGQVKGMPKYEAINICGYDAERATFIS